MRLTDAKLAVAVGGLSLAFFGVQAFAAPANGTWLNDAGGVWTTGTNWQGGVPISTTVATFGNVPITADRTVTLATSQSVGGLTFKNETPYKWTIQRTGGNGLTLGANSFIDVQGGVAVVSAKLLGASGYTKSGVGTLSLPSVGGSGDLGGTINVTQGTLNLANRQLLGQNIQVAVSSGATLSGSGTIGSNTSPVNVGLTVATGAEFTSANLVANTQDGLLTVNGTLNLGSGAEYHVYVDDIYSSLSAASQFEALTLVQTGVTKVNVTGMSALAGLFDASYPAGYSWKIGHLASGVFNLNNFDLNENEISGFFGVENGAGFSLSLSGNKSDLYLQYSAVPEATTMILGGMAVMPILMQRRRQRGAAAQA